MDIETANLGYLPDEIIFCILLCLPADVIYNVMRYVCRRWYNIIKSPVFISSHLQRITKGLIIHRHLSIGTAYFLQVENSGVELQDIKCQFPGRVMDSCNGLVLFFDKKSRNTLYVANPVTKQHLRLPRFGDGQSFRSCYFAFVESTGVYKVISVKNSRFQILTIGVDERWRSLETSSFRYMNVEELRYPPITLAGCLMHWIGPGNIVIFDGETETFREISRPRAYKYRLIELLAIGGSLSLLRFREETIWELWVLTNPQHGEWEKLYDINLEPVRRCLATQYLGMESSDLIVLNVTTASAFCIILNVKTGKTVFDSRASGLPPLQNLSDYFTVKAHVKSLVPLPEQKNNTEVRLTRKRKSALQKQRQLAN